MGSRGDLLGIILLGEPVDVTGQLVPDFGGETTTR